MFNEKYLLDTLTIDKKQQKQRDKHGSSSSFSRNRHVQQKHNAGLMVNWENVSVIYWIRKRILEATMVHFQSLS